MAREDTLDYVRSVIANEGFEYAFVCYSHFKEVKDKKFHELRKEYIKAHKALEDYLDEQD